MSNLQYTEIARLCQSVVNDNYSSLCKAIRGDVPLLLRKNGTELGYLDTIA